MKYLIVLILFFSGCSRRTELTNTSSPDVNIENIVSLIQHFFYDKDEFAKNFYSGYRDLNSYEKRAFSRVISFIYWKIHDEHQDGLDEVGSTITRVLAMPLDFYSKHESKRIALHSTNDRDREWAISFYTWNPSVLDFPFLKKYKETYGVDASPFLIFPDRFWAYNLEKLAGYVDIQNDDYNFSRFKKAALLQKKDIYEQMNRFWDTSFWMNELAEAELVSYGYPENDLIPEKFVIYPGEKDLFNKILGRLNISGLGPTGQPAN